MEAVVIDSVVQENLVRVPARFNNRRIRLVIIDANEDDQKVYPKKLNFKIDESLGDIVPFADVKDSRLFVEKLRVEQWQ